MNQAVTNTLNTRIALFLSIVLHPLLMPTYLFGLLFLFVPEELGINTLSLSAQGSLLLLLFMNTFLAPALVIFYFYKLGYIRSLHLDTLADRRLPYITTVIIYTFATYLFGWQFAPISDLAPSIAVVLGSITFSMAVVALISLRWKISAHATGMGGCLGAIACFFLRYGDSTLFYPLILGILITGWLMSARLHLNAHTPTQVGAGLALGIVVSSVAIFVFF